MTRQAACIREGDGVQGGGSGDSAHHVIVWFSSNKIEECA